MLVEGPRADGSDDLIIEPAGAPLGARLVAPSEYQLDGQAERIAHAQAVQLVRGDAFYGSVSDWERYAEICGRALAHAHALSDEVGALDRDIEPEILAAAAPVDLFVDDIVRFAEEAAGSACAVTSGHFATTRRSAPSARSTSSTAELTVRTCLARPRSVQMREPAQEGTPSGGCAARGPRDRCVRAARRAARGAGARPRRQRTRRPAARHEHARSHARRPRQRLAARPRLNHDVLLGGFGSDKLFGDGGNDRLKGDTGDDKLVGGVGIDQLFGGTDEKRRVAVMAMTASTGWPARGDDILLGGEGRHDSPRGGFGKRAGPSTAAPATEHQHQPR